MTMNLLCTVSEDPNMFNGLRFLSRFFENKSRFRLTLLCMAAPDSSYCQWKAGNLKAEGTTNPMESDHNWIKAHEEALRMLKWEGFSEDNILSKCSTNMACRIEDILDELDTENYDAVVMGRRGLNRLKDFASKTLSKKLLDQEQGTPMWLCRKPDFNRKNVLLCADGSDSSYRMAAHVADVLAEEEHIVTLCRIVKIKSDNREESNNIFSRCEEIMASRGFDTSRLRQMIYPSDHVARAIVDNANWGRFAVVAMGRTGSNLKRMFFGSVTGTLFTELSGSVLWVHP